MPGVMTPSLGGVSPWASFGNSLGSGMQFTQPMSGSPLSLGAGGDLSGMGSIGQALSAIRPPQTQAPPVPQAVGGQPPQGAGVGTMEPMQVLQLLMQLQGGKGPVAPIGQLLGG